MKTLYTFRINTGSHVDENNVRHVRGSKFKTSVNLTKHNLPGENRFELLDKESVEDNAPIEESQTDEDGGDQDEEVDLNSLTVAQLQDYAEENEIDLEDATKKADIIAAIQLSEEDA